MAKKTPYRRNPKRKSGGTPVMPDRRAMEKTIADMGRLMAEREFESIDEINAYMQSLLASGEPLPTPGPRSAVEEAQELMYQAWDATGQRRVKLARQALRVSPDCADAYVLLAEETATSLEEARGLYATGVAAGERALGPAAFGEHVGHFWGVLETRPYMRARAGLAGCLWLSGQRQEAIRHYQEMLRLNPGDNQGLRYLLLTHLLEEGMDVQAQKLLKEYDEGTATWLYNSALLLYRQNGESNAATARLRQALKHNPHVPEYLLGKRHLPREMPPYLGWGDENEAIDYVDGAGHLWLQEEGGIDWLRRIAAA